MIFFSIFLLVVVLICSARSTQSTVTNRIVGGNAAFAGQFPYSAAIYKSTTDATFFCGGCLLNNEWIVTAGQCVDGALLFTIRLGTNNLNSNDPNALRLATDYYVLHPDFNTLTLENDVGLIKLRMPIEFTSYIRPIHYLPVGDLAPYTGTTGIGWGQVDDSTPGLVDTLRWVKLTVIPNEECQMIFGQQILENMVCVDGNYNEGTCKGDSGGPLVQDLGKGYVMQVGIASFISSNGCESTDPSGYTKIFPYVDWIFNVTGMPPYS
jgi:secreted trypsin-like serine protease